MKIIVLLVYILLSKTMVTKCGYDYRVLPRNPKGPLSPPDLALIPESDPRLIRNADLVNIKNGGSKKIVGIKPHYY